MHLPPTSRRPATRAVSLLVVAAILSLAACSDDESADTAGTITSEPVGSNDGGTSVSSESPTDEPTPTSDVQATTTVAGDGGPGEVRLTPVVEVGSLSALAAHPDSGDLFLAQRDGIVVVVGPDGSGEPETVLDMSDRTEASGERGLLGVAISPDTDYLYLYYTNTEGDSRLDEYPLDGRAVDAEGRREVLALDQPFPNHNGGQIAFGPGGLLYVGLGDGGSGGDPLGAGQDTGQLLGKILRIDPRGGDAAAGEPGYGIPEDNPFVDGGGAPEVWLFGVRNPWRFSWDRGNSDLWVADVGQEQIEEVTVLPSLDGGGPPGKGANLGWNEMEGDQPYDAGVEPADHVGPAFTYTHDEGCSITGGYVYRGEALPFLDGIYVFGDYCTSELWGLRLEGGEVVERLDLGVNPGANQLVSFGEGLDGELYVLADDGTLYRLDPA